MFKVARSDTDYLFGLILICRFLLFSLLVRPSHFLNYPPLSCSLLSVTHLHFSFSPLILSSFYSRYYRYLLPSPLSFILSTHLRSSHLHSSPFHFSPPIYFPHLPLLSCPLLFSTLLSLLLSSLSLTFISPSLLSTPLISSHLLLTSTRHVPPGCQRPEKLSDGNVHHSRT